MTQKQRLFVDLYAKTGNAAEAYKAVYACKSNDVAKACASRLLTKANVRAYMAELNGKIEQDTIMSLVEIQKMYDDIAHDPAVDPNARIKALDSLSRYRGITRQEEMRFEMEKMRLELEKKRIGLEKKRISLEERKIENMNDKLTNGDIKVVLSNQLQEWGE